MNLKANNRVRFVVVVILLFVINNEKAKGSKMENLSPLYGFSVEAKKNGNSSLCYEEFNKLKSAVDDGKVWGLKVLDSSGRPSEGFLYGNNLWLGSHSQCLDIQNRKPFEIRLDKVNRTLTPFDYPPYPLGFAVVMLRHNSTLQYRMRLPLDYIIQLGLCLPKSCKENEILHLAEEYFSKDPLNFQREYRVGLQVEKVRVLQEDGLWMLKLPKVILLFTIIGIILILTIVGTVYDVRRHNKKKNLIRGHNSGILSGKMTNIEAVSTIELTPSTNLDENNNFWPLDILRCFSFYSNFKKWAQPKVSADSLKVIHGLKFFAMTWVIFVHTSFFQADFSRNPPYAWRLTEDFFGQIYSNSTYCVDTFFFLSGFLLAYIYFKNANQKSKSGSFALSAKKFIFMFLNRFFRLTPTYLIVLLFSNCIYTFYSKKSSLYFTERPDMACDKYWWRNLLYINNLFPRSEMCLSWSWYLSIDMQFYLIGSFLLILSTAWFSVAAVLVVLLILVQIAATAYKSYIIGYIPTMDDQLEHLDAIYDLPWNRIGPYLIGIVTAYILVIKLDNKLILKNKTRAILWTIFPLLNLWILFALYTRQVSVEFAAFYMGVSRTLWGVGIGWFVLAVSTGNARLIEKLLSYAAWVPLGRLTYCAYLLNPLVVTMIALGSEDGILMSVSQMAVSCNGTLMITMLLSLLFSVLFESPFILMTKLLFKSISSNKSESAGNNNN